MPPIVWTGRSGEEVETVIAVMLSRRFPRAERIRASRGDGGIDVQVPESDGWSIYQIKNYTTRFYKDKVERSYRRLKQYAEDEGINVTSWNLIMPMDPSKEARKWLTSLTSDAGFPCGWPGEIFVNNLAAEFMDVYEYYWGDGKRELAQLISQVADFRNTVQTGRDSTREAPLQPNDISDSLGSIFQAINRFDPHFRYALSVDSIMPPPVAKPELILQSTTGIGGCFVTYEIFPLYKEALSDRPITIRVNAAAEPGTTDATAIENFLDYGTPFQTGNASVSLVVDAPGGLGGTLPVGRFWVGPTAEDEAIPDRRLRLQVANEDRELLAETVILVRPPTTGVRRRGYRTVGRDQGGSFTLEQIQEATESASQSTLTLADVSGLVPADVLPGLMVLANFHGPNVWRIGELYGPLADEFDLISARPSDGILEVLLLVEAVKEIQQHTSLQLRVPAIKELSDREAQQIIIASGLVQGYRHVENIVRYESGYEEGLAQLREGGPQNVTWTSPLSVSFGSQNVNLGLQRLWAQGVDITLSRREDGTGRFSMTPHEGNTFVMSRARIGDEPAP